MNIVAKEPGPFWVVMNTPTSQFYLQLFGHRKGIVVALKVNW